MNALEAVKKMMALMLEMRDEIKGLRAERSVEEGCVLPSFSSVEEVVSYAPDNDRQMVCKFITLIFLMYFPGVSGTLLQFSGKILFSTMIHSSDQKT